MSQAVFILRHQSFKIPGFVPKFKVYTIILILANVWFGVLFPWLIIVVFLIGYIFGCAGVVRVFLRD